jgi:hypothetical protein
MDKKLSLLYQFFEFLNLYINHHQKYKIIKLMLKIYFKLFNL